MLKEELNSKNNPCVATGIFRTATFRNFPSFHSVIRNQCQLLLICVLLTDARVSTNYGFVFFSVCVCTEFKISCKILNMLFVCVSDFVLIGKDALQSEM
jgi:hypothetical protein